MIRHKGNKFYVEVFNPQHEWKYQGRVINLKEGQQAFLTHLKIPSKHFYIKRQGYPINKELLETLKNAKINYIIIPERGKTGFRCYLSPTTEYLHGETISEPLTEMQRVIPLRELKEVDIPEEKIKGILYD